MRAKMITSKIKKDIGKHPPPPAAGGWNHEKLSVLLACVKWQQRLKQVLLFFGDKQAKKIPEKHHNLYSVHNKT